MHTKAKQIPSIVFNAVKDEKLFDLVKIETEKTRKRFYEDRPFKEGDKVLCSSRIKEVEGRTKHHLVSKWKTKGNKCERY